MNRLRGPLLLTSFVGLAGFAAWHFVQAHSWGTTTTPAAPAHTSPVRIEGIGYVEPRSEIRRLVPQIGGVIRRCQVRVGESVKQGDPLVEMEGSSQAAEVVVAAAQLELARAKAADVRSGINPLRIALEEKALERLKVRHQHSETEFGRIQRLFTAKTSTQSDLDSATNDLKQAAISVAEQEAQLHHLRQHVTDEQRRAADAEVTVAEASLARAKQSLANTTLVAPFDGTVLRWLKREGEGVSPVSPEPVLLFGDVSRLHIRAEIDERNVTAVCAGMRAEVYGTNLRGTTSHGQVVAIEQVMGNKTVFSHSAAERMDLDVVQVIIEMDSAFVAPIGLRVDVRLSAEELVPR